MQLEFDNILAGLFPNGGKVLLGVSGGVDSIVMADLFLHNNVDIEFEVAHCNFMLRGGDSFSDELFVANWCATNRIKLHRISFQTKEFSTTNGLSIEMAARQLRYEWFDGLIKEGGFDAISIAHNANDNAETLFLNLLRGTGIKGITGMRLKSNIPIEGSMSLLIRPLLSFSRDDIEEYAMKKGIMFCFDKTNMDVEYKRNKIRNIVFPIFSELNPSFLSTISKNIRHFIQVESIADDYYFQVLPYLTQKIDGGIKINISSLMGLKNKSYVIYRLLGDYGFNSNMAIQVEDLLDRGSTIAGKQFISDKYRLVTTSESLIIVGRKSNDGNEDFILLDTEGEFEFNGRKFLIEISSNRDEWVLNQPEGVVLWDEDKHKFPLKIRKWRVGDWFIPLGLNGRKKLSDYFTDRKFSLIDKENVVVSEIDDNHIGAIFCLRIDDSLKITSKTSKILIIKELI